MELALQEDWFPKLPSICIHIRGLGGFQFHNEAINADQGPSDPL